MNFTGCYIAHGPKTPPSPDKFLDQNEPRIRAYALPVRAYAVLVRAYPLLVRAYDRGISAYASPVRAYEPRIQAYEHRVRAYEPLILRPKTGKVLCFYVNTSPKSRLSNFSIFSNL
jgi:hypothetical protein